MLDARYQLLMTHCFHCAARHTVNFERIRIVAQKHHAHAERFHDGAHSRLLALLGIAVVLKLIDLNNDDPATAAEDNVWSNAQTSIAIDWLVMAEDLIRQA